MRPGSSSRSRNTARKCGILNGPVGDPITRLATTNTGKKGVGNKRITPGGWEQRTGQRLRFVYRRGQPSLLVAETRLNSKGRAVASRSKTGRGLATVPIFILVPQVKLPERLSLEGPALVAEASLPGLIVANWEARNDV